MRIQITLTHEGKVFEGETELMQTGSAKKTPTRTKPASAKLIATRPGEAVDQLYREGFCKVQRTLTDVRKELAKKELNFGTSSVLMALQAAAFILQKGKKGSYTFIQKYPPRG